MYPLFKSLIICLVLTSVKTSSLDEEFGESKPKPTPYQDWDYLVYSQRWPITSCTEWEERSSKNTCAMPQNSTIWVVHGVWPTKTGHEGPFYCDSAIHFDPDQLTPMMSDLNEYWPNIESNTEKYSFWKHEWGKHGTCASTLPLLNSITNYFQQGLDWNQEYNIENMFLSSNIVPNKVGYTIEEIYNSIKSSINKKPMIQCVVDGTTKESLISEVRICFNKDFDLIDCDVSNPIGDDDILTNCALKKPVMYLSTIPQKVSYDFTYLDTVQRIVEATVRLRERLEKRFEANLRFREKLLNFYAMIKFIMWFTL